MQVRNFSQCTNFLTEKLFMLAYKQLFMIKRLALARSMLRARLESSLCNVLAYDFQHMLPKR